MLKKIATLITAAVAVVLAFGVAGAAATVSAAPPKAVGWCAKQSGGAVRMLEPKNVAKSQHGKCKTGESKVLLPTTVAKGATGATGKSAYEIWLGQTGNAGKTEAQYLASLKGADGKDGRGLDGAPFNMTFAGNGPWKCSWVKATETLACVTP